VNDALKEDGSVSEDENLASEMMGVESGIDYAMKEVVLVSRYECNQVHFSLPPQQKYARAI